MSKKQLSAGFSLIEVMIVISLMVMLLLTATSLFLTTLIGSSKTSSSVQVKEEGDFAIGQIEFLLRNAIAILPNSSSQTCQAGMEEFVIQSYDNGVTTLVRETDSSDGVDKIASNSGVYLTSGDLELTDGPTFNCTQTSDGGSQYVEASFTLRKGTPGIDLARDIVEETFSTGVNVRGVY